MSESNIKKDETNLRCLLKKYRFNKLPMEVIEEVEHYIKNGVRKVLVAKAVGISRNTFNRWLRVGKALHNNLDLSEADSKDLANATDEYMMQTKEFYERVGKAEAELALKLAGNIVKASGKQWKAGAWMLERRFTEEYGRSDKKYIEGNMQERIEVKFHRVNLLEQDSDSLVDDDK